MYNSTMKRILPLIILLSLILASCASWGDREPTVALEPLVEETVPITEEEAVAEQETALEEPLDVNEASIVEEITEDDGILPVTDEPIGGSPEAETIQEPLNEPLTEPIPETLTESLVEPLVEPLPESSKEPQPIPDAVPNTEAPKEEADTARIGDMVLPKWFIYTFSALFLALLMALCYMSNNRKKSLYYRGRD